MKVSAFFLLIIFSTIPHIASSQEMNAGFLFGNKHAFYFTAPEGWLLDNQSGIHQGLHMVFYLKGQTWSDSPVIAYGKSCVKDEVLKTVEDLVNYTINDFHLKGSQNYIGERKPSIFLPNGTEIEVYYYAGDQWGNYEAVGYIEEEETINYLVFNARTKKDFNLHMSAFNQLLLSYRNAYPKNDELLNEKDFRKLVEEAERCANSSEGKSYERSVINSLGQKMATTMRDCLSYLSEEKITDFEVVFKIENVGKISEIHTRPLNSLSVCFQGMIRNSKLPKHKFDYYIQHIGMHVTE